MGRNCNEPDKAFRDKWFHGKDRELLAQGKWHMIDLGDVPEHDFDGRIRQGYLVELGGDMDTAQQIYASVGFAERLNDDDYDYDYDERLLDEEVEHYTE
jgi:hypothetical protein